MIIWRGSHVTHSPTLSSVVFLLRGGGGERKLKWWVLVPLLHGSCSVFVIPAVLGVAVWWERARLTTNDNLLCPCGQVQLQTDERERMATERKSRPRRLAVVSLVVSLASSSRSVCLGVPYKDPQRTTLPAQIRRADLPAPSVMQTNTTSPTPAPACGFVINNATCRFCASPASMVKEDAATLSCAYGGSYHMQTPHWSVTP